VDCSFPLPCYHDGYLLRPATINLHKIYFPSHFLYKFFPMFRAYARFGVLVLLCVSVLAGFGVKLILAKLRSSRSRGIFLALAFGLIFFEFLDVPPWHNVRFDPLPVYEFIAQQPGDFAILVYPPDKSNYDLLAQRVHQKRFLNPKGRTPAEVQGVVEDLNTPESVSKLREWGVRYIVVRDTKDPDFYENHGFFDLEDMVSVLGFGTTYPLVTVYDKPRVYLFAVPD